MINKLVHLERRFAWSLLGFLLAAVLGSLTIYTEFFRDTRPSLEFKILSDASVLDVREEVNDLEILYAGSDIKKSRQSLRVIVVRISNTGSQDILKTYYDDNSPLGFTISGGTIIRADVMDTGEAYLADNLKISVLSQSQVTFSPLILQSEQYFTVKTLILHPETSRPSLSPTGKVAMVKAMNVVETIEPVGQSLLKRALGGSLGVQFLRLPLYFFGFILFLGGAILLVAAPSSWIENATRRRKIRRFREISTHKSEALDFILDKYLEDGALAVSVLNGLLDGGTSIDWFVRDLDTKKGTDRPIRPLHTRTSDMPPHFYEGVTRFTYSYATDLIHTGLIKKVDGHYELDAQLREAFDEFKKYLRAVGE